MSEPNNEKNNQNSQKTKDELLKSNLPIDRSERKIEDSLKDIDEMLSNPDKLKDGYNLLSKFETRKNFYLNFLKISFDSSLNKNKLRMKLSGCCFICFLKKNYEIEGFITDEEKLNIVSFLLDKISTNDYYLKNFIAKVLGYIGAKEFPNCYESFIKILLGFKFLCINL